MKMTGSQHERTSPSTLPFTPPFYYGWILVGVSALIYFFSGPGQTYGVSTFIESYITEFSWSRSLVSSMYSLGTMGAGLFMGFMGGFFDRRGHRFMTTLIVLLFGITCLGMSFVNSLSALFLGFLLIRLLGQGGMGLSGTTLPPQWFTTKRGQAQSLVSLGDVFGSAILPPLNIWLIENFSWRFSWRFWAILLMTIMAPLAYFLIRNRPEDVDLLPDNRMTSEGQDDLEPFGFEEVFWTAQEAVRTRAFWFLLFCFIVPSAIVTGLIFHHISIMQEVGLTPMAAAFVLSSMALVRIPVFLIAGPIADRMQPRYLLALAEGGICVTYVILLYANSVQTALAYAILLGIMLSFFPIVGAVAWPGYFGRQHLSSIRGFTMTATVIGTGLGPLPFGVAYDLFGGYSEMLAISLVLQFLTIITAILAHPPQKQKSTQ